MLPDLLPLWSGDKRISSKSTYLKVKGFKCGNFAGVITGFSERIIEWEFGSSFFILENFILKNEGVLAE